MSRLGERLARLRAAHGESVRKAAARCDLSHPTWSRLERGESEGDDETLAKVARAYGVSVDYLKWGRDLRTEFTEHLRALTAARRGHLLAGPAERMQTVLEFITRRGHLSHTPARIAEAAGLEEGEVRRAIANPGWLNEQRLERLNAAVQHVTGGALGGDWVRHGVEEAAQVETVVRQSLAALGQHLSAKAKARRHKGAPPGADRDLT